MRSTITAIIVCWLLLAAGARAGTDWRAFLSKLTPAASGPQAWKHAFTGGPWVPIKAGEHFREGDSLKTAPGSQAELAFPNGIVARLLKGAEVQVRSQGVAGTGLILKNGTIVVITSEGLLQVMTANAVANGRHAQWLVQQSTRGTRVATIAGTVKVYGEINEPVHEIQEVDENQQAMIPMEGPAAAPVAVDPQLLANEAGLPGPGPQAAVTPVPASTPVARVPSPSPPVLAAASPAIPVTLPSPLVMATPAPVAPPVQRQAKIPLQAEASPIPASVAPSPVPTVQRSPLPVATVMPPRLTASTAPTALPLVSPAPHLAPASTSPSAAPTVSPEPIVIPPWVEPTSQPSPAVLPTPAAIPSPSPAPSKKPARRPPSRLAASPLPLPADPPSPTIAPGVLARMIVMKREHRLYFYDPDGSLKKVYKIGLGARGTPTPSGVRAVWEKVANPTGIAWALWPSSRGRAFGNRMLVLMWYDPIHQHYTYKSHQELHGTDVRVSVGGNMSHGCMRMLNEDIEEIYRNARKGDIIVVRD